MLAYRESVAPAVPAQVGLGIHPLVALEFRVLSFEALRLQQVGHPAVALSATPTESATIGSLHQLVPVAATLLALPQASPSVTAD